MAEAGIAPRDSVASIDGLRARKRLPPLGPPGTTDLIPPRAWSLSNYFCAHICIQSAQKAYKYV
jgi:hypothetical protein